MSKKQICNIKAIISIILVILIPFEILFYDINMSITSKAANYTIKEEDLFKYPKLTYYLENEEYNSIITGFYDDCTSALNTVTTSEERDAVIIDSFSNGASYITTEIGAMFGLCDDNFDKANKALAMEVLEEYMVTTFVGSDGYLETTGYFSDAADVLGFSDGALDFSKAVDEERFKNSLSSLDEYYTYEDLDKLLGTGGVRDKISTAIGVYDDSVEFNKVLFSALALAQLDYVAVNDLLENVDVGTDLWRALYSIRSDIEKDKVEYVLKTYLSNQAVKNISKALKNVALKSFSKSSIILVGVFVDLVEFVYGKFKPSVNDIHHAFMMQSYVIEAERSLHDIEKRFQSGKYTADDISAYKSTYNFYLACIQQYLKKCKTLVDKHGASTNEINIKAKLDRDISVINGMSYNSYINRCICEAQKAVDNGTVTISTNTVVIKDKKGNVIDENYDSTESILSRLSAIQAVYKPNVGQTWTASYQGCIQCCGFAKLVFNKLFGYDISGYVGNRRYMLSNENNVIKVGQLVGNEVTVTNLKNMFSKAKVGDYIQMNGSTWGQHSAIFLSADDSGVTVYDCNWDTKPCAINIHKFTWNNLYNWYSQPSSESMNGVSVYRATNYSTIYGDGDDLFYDDSVNFVIQNGVLTKYNGFAAYVIIPDTVTEIGASAFKGNTYIEFVEIPDTVTKIGNNAFEDCTQLKSIYIPDSVEEIGFLSFSGCVNLSNVRLTENEKFEIISSNTFNNCKELYNINIPASVTEIDSGAFYNCEKISDVSLPSGLIKLGGESFKNCKAITSITIPKTLTNVWGSSNSLYKGPFYGCDNLKEINFAEGITKIPGSLFDYCQSLEEITIPDTVTSIGSYSFNYCNNLTSIVIPNSVTEIDDGAFKNCDKLSNVTLPIGLLTLGGDAFNNCKSITSITIPKTLTNVWGSSNSLYKGPFYGCDNLKEINFAEGITKIPGSLFDYCQSLEEITIPDTVTSIGSYSFNNCTNLISIDIPDGVTGIGEGAFKNCKKLNNVILPKDLLVAEQYVFYGCESLDNIIMPNCISKIYKSSFYGCTGLNEIAIPNKVTQIDQSAFANCTSLKKVVIPSSCKTIGNSAFSHCESLTDLTISEGVENINSNAFEYNIALQSVTLPDSLTSLGDRAFQYCDVLDTVNLGNGITTIPKYCFYQDPNLVSIILPQQVTKVDEYAFANCTKFNDITMNRKVNSASINAFSYPNKLTIHGIAGTYAQTFANANNITFSSINKPAQSIKFSKDTLNIGKGEKTKLIVNINPIDASDELVWVSTDEDVITVDSDGNIQAVNTGEATIMVMAGDISAECNVLVYKAVSSVSLNKSNYSGTIGDFVNLTATVYPSDATYKTYKWSSSDESIATVDENGKVTLMAYGTATITATTDDKNITANCTITVNPVSVSSIKLNCKSAKVEIGGTVELIPTISPENATNKNIIWTSNKTSVATVDENGVVTGVSEGKAIIIAKTEDGSKTASCTVNVGEEQTSVKVSSLKINEGNTEITVGDTKKLSVTISPSNATNNSVTWSSDNSKIVTVDSNGNVKGLATGTATITVKANDGSGISTNCVITVKQKPDVDDGRQTTSTGTITTSGIYCASNYPAIQAGINIQKSNENDVVEYRWVACNNNNPNDWFEISPWTKNNNWMSWTPEKSGGYVFVCYARVVGNEDASQIDCAFGTEYHKDIKGICQMPYTGEGGGYLIGIESYDNPNNSYQYEMLILDCNLYMQGQDAWVYTTGRCGAQGNCLWTIWQPVYGYYWTLFRIYDSNGVLIDEACYGFENVN